MEKCAKAILSIVPLKSWLLCRECVKENKVYETVLFAVAEPLASERAAVDGKNIYTNLIKVGVLYDTVYSRLHTGQWNAVPPDERKMFTILTYMRILYILYASNSLEDAIKDCIYLADLGLMLGCPIVIECKAAATDLLTETASILTKQLATSCKQEPPFKRIKLDEIGEASCRTDNKLSDVPVLECPSLEFFGSQYYDKQKPAILKGIIDGWPAMERWHDSNYLLKVAGERTVPIEIGSQYSNDDWSQKLMKFRDFLEKHICSELSCNSTETQPAAPAAYLAQHDLFDQIPALRADIAVPDYIGRTDSRPRIRAWLGPKGTVSPLHTDPCHNFLCQVFGAKLIILARPEDTEKLYPHDHFILSNTSQVDARRLDYDRFPLVRDVRFLRLTLQRGEVLYIPPKWWHYVESLSPSFSVSFWFE
uniref:JmjC domain-containing protein n=1 Tax=Anopheles epiroticus TaxID=199890 RepID=A0A182PTJ7_9DIPT